MKPVPYKVEKQRLAHDLRCTRKVLDSCIKHQRWEAAKSTCDRVRLLVRHLQLLEIQQTHEA
jgi:hypothetical protein